jgi:hypothetical protein
MHVASHPICECTRALSVAGALPMKSGGGFSRAAISSPPATATPFWVLALRRGMCRPHAESCRFIVVRRTSWETPRMLPQGALP